MIYRVMLVEDEPPMMRSLQRAILNCPRARDIQVVATAGNGAKALDLIPVVKPHILLSDVKMPVMDGLGLIERVKAKYPGIQTAILSGYQEYEYFKKALRFQISDYLLKPIDHEELSTLLSRMKAAARQVLDQDMNSYLRTLVDNRPMAEAPEQSYRHYCVTLLNSGCYCQPENWEDYPPLGTPDLSPLMQALTELSGEHELWLYPSNCPNRMVAAAGFDDDAAPDIERALRRIHTSAALTLAYTFLDEVDGFPSALRRVHRLVQERLIPHRSQWINADRAEPSQQPALIGLSLTEEAALAERLDARDIAGFRSTLRHIMLGRFDEDTPQSCIQRLYGDLLTLLKKRLNGMTSEDLTVLESLLIEVSHAADSLADFISALCEQLYGFILQLNHSVPAGATTESVVQKIRQYVETHYNSPICFLSLASEFGISYCYLSTLYKKACGLSPSRHLVNLRIDKAKELIAGNPDIRFRQVALLVGYEDPHYFSRVFRLVTGMSPTEFRDKA